LSWAGGQVDCGATTPPAMTSLPCPALPCPALPCPAKNPTSQGCSCPSMQSGYESEHLFAIFPVLGLDIRSKYTWHSLAVVCRHSGRPYRCAGRRGRVAGGEFSRIATLSAASLVSYAEPTVANIRALAPCQSPGRSSVVDGMRSVWCKNIRHFRRSLGIPTYIRNDDLHEKLVARLSMGTSQKAWS